MMRRLRNDRERVADNCERVAARCICAPNTHLWSDDDDEDDDDQGCISCVMCSYPELTKDHVLTSAYVKIFRTVTSNAVNKSV